MFPNCKTLDATSPTPNNFCFRLNQPVYSAKTNIYYHYHTSGIYTSWPRLNLWVEIVSQGWWSPCLFKERVGNVVTGRGCVGEDQQSEVGVHLLEAPKPYTWGARCAVPPSRPDGTNRCPVRWDPPPVRDTTMCGVLRIPDYYFC